MITELISQQQKLSHPMPTLILSEMKKKLQKKQASYSKEFEQKLPADYNHVETFLLRKWD